MSVPKDDGWGGTVGRRDTSFLLNHWAFGLGGHCRTGLKDNVRYDKDRLSAIHAEWVERVARLATQGLPSTGRDRHPSARTACVTRGRLNQA